MAALPHPLRRQPHVGDPEGQLAVGEDATALGLQPTRSKLGSRTVRPGAGRPAEKLPAVVDHLEQARADAFPKEIWRQIWSSNPQERLNRENHTAAPTVINMVGIFPDRGALIRLDVAVLAEQHDDWIEGRRYLGLDVLAKSRITIVDTTAEVTPDTDLTALSA